LIGLLKYQHTPPAEQTLSRLLASTSPADRILAAQVLGELDRPQFQLMHKTLLKDPDSNVRREALESAGKSHLRELYPLLIEACDSPETSNAATLALINIGADAFAEIEAAFTQPDAPRGRLLAMAKAIGRISGKRAYALLLPHVKSTDGELRSEILKALSTSGYRTKDHSVVSTAIKVEAGEVARACAVQADLGDADETALLSAALQQFAGQARERMLLLLSFLLDPRLRRAG
jgi:HEAT repeat protein